MSTTLTYTVTYTKIGMRKFAPMHAPCVPTHRSRTAVHWCVRVDVGARFKATLTWADVPPALITDSALVNDLDLVLSDRGSAKVP